MDPERDAWSDDLWSAFDTLEAMVAHIHEDVRALRAHLGIPRPECYPEVMTEDERLRREREEHP